ncbi:ankyrin-3-like [Gigantopelta aegis]|uniref:ankyrin-3-like n=1 Tax=Gigantopelta aegis TaxID=1735272 RepID=UPI001B8879DF|nr:ankyrin-3-like [Gigantopelta aegis]
MLKNMTNVNIQNKNGLTIFHCLYYHSRKYVFRQLSTCDCNEFDIEKTLTDIMLQNSVDTRTLDYEGCSVLHYACITARAPTVRKLILTGISVNYQNMYGEAAIHLAASVSPFSTNVDVLVEHHASVNTVDYKGNTAVHAAVGKYNTKGLKALIRNSADINIRNKALCTPLHDTLQRSFAGIEIHPMKTLLKAGADPFIRNKEGLTFFEAVLSEGNYMALDVLLSVEGSFLTKVKQNFHIPLKRWNILKTLLTWGFNPNALDDSGNGPLHIAACHYDYYDRAVLLLKHDADPNLPNDFGDAPLHIATNRNHGKLVKLLLSKGADFYNGNTDSDTALHICKGKGNYDSATALLFSTDTPSVKNAKRYRQKFFTKVNARFKRKTTILRKRPKLEPINVLLEHIKTIEDAPGIDQRNNDGDSPLHCAAYKGCCQKVALLLKYGASLSEPNDHDHLPLHCAARGGQWKTIELMLNYGSTMDVDIQTQDGCSPLHLSCAKGHVVTVKKLVEKGADVNLANENGDGPIHCAAQFGKTAVVATLLSSGADVNMQNNDGETALHLAAKYVKVKVVKLLLQRGTDQSVCNISDLTAEQLAANVFSDVSDLKKKTTLLQIQHVLSNDK